MDYSGELDWGGGDYISIIWDMQAVIGYLIMIYNIRFEATQLSWLRNPFLKIHQISINAPSNSQEVPRQCAPRRH